MQQDTELMLLLLSAMSDIDVPSGSLMLVIPCQKKGFLVTTDDFAIGKQAGVSKKKDVRSAKIGRTHAKRVMMTFQIFRE